MSNVHSAILIIMSSHYWLLAQVMGNSRPVKWLIFWISCWLHSLNNNCNLTHFLSIRQSVKTYATCCNPVRGVCRRPTAKHKLSTTTLRYQHIYHRTKTPSHPVDSIETAMSNLWNDVSSIMSVFVLYTRATLVVTS